MSKVYTNIPMNYKRDNYRKNINHNIKPVILICTVVIAMFTVKYTVADPYERQGFADVAVMTANLNMSVVTTVNSPEPRVINGYYDDEFYFPLDGPVTSVFAVRDDPFGSDNEEYHEGIDIAAIDSYDVCAASYGEVKFVGRSASYGNYLIITHSDTLETLYAHCEDIFVSEGDIVDYGDVIAKAGNTGRSTAPHLHFEVRVNNERVDPLGYLSIK